jgi:hypothetical protein
LSVNSMPSRCILGRLSIACCKVRNDEEDRGVAPALAKGALSVNMGPANEPSAIRDSI